jgi:hypothetical protein
MIHLTTTATNLDYNIEWASLMNGELGRIYKET